jgi:type IV pilus secretin PilQ/predicted competence protein
MSAGQRQGLLIAAGLLVAVLCLAAGPKPAVSNPGRFLGVTVQASDSGNTLIDVATTEAAPYHVFRLEHPKRLVLDLEDTELTGGDRLYAGQGPLVERIRLGQRVDQGSPVVRVVADLKQDYGFDVRHTPNGVEELIWTGAGLVPAAAVIPSSSVAVPVASVREADPPAALPLLGKPGVWDGLLPKLADAAPVVATSSESVDLRTPSAYPAPPGTSQVPRSQLSFSAVLAAALKALGPAAQAPAPAPLVAKDAAGAKLASRAVVVPPIASGEPSHRVVPLPVRPVARKGVEPATSVDLTESAPLERLASATPPPAPRLKPTSPAASIADATLRGAPAQAVPPPPPAPPNQPAAQTQTSLGPESCGEPPYTGERNSFNLKDVDLKDFFRLIHEISGLNVVVDSNVSGTVTLALDNVPWDQALHFVLGNNGLVCTVEGNVLRIAKAQTLVEEAKAAPLVTVIRYLHYATASDVNLNNVVSASGGGGVNPPPTMFGVATILKNMGDKVLGPGGTVSADPRDNAVVFSCLRRQVPIVQAVIDKLDQKSKQISIEARIVLTTNDVVREIQTSLTNFLRNTSGTVTGAGTTGVGSSAQGVPPATLPSPPSLPVITQMTPGGFGAYAIANQTAKYFISAAIAAAETKNQAKTISAPTIVTQNNVPGVVSQGTQVPVQTVINNTVTTVYINATLTLGVTPVVSADGAIFLNIVVQNNSPGPVIPGTNNPEINTQAATTQVLVPDGGAVVFGGVKITNNTRSVNQVPGLGDVPLLGHLFKSTNRESLENELIFVVTPKILG